MGDDLRLASRGRRRPPARPASLSCDRRPRRLGVLRGRAGTRARRRPSCTEMRFNARVESISSTGSGIRTTTTARRSRPGTCGRCTRATGNPSPSILDLRARPLQVALSRHCAGATRPWARAPRRGQRPLVHVAFGSHANYFGVGTFSHDAACWPRELRDVVRALRLVDHTGEGRIVRPRLVRVTATQPAWMTFAGAWGEDGYVHFANNPPVAYRAGPSGAGLSRAVAPSGDARARLAARLRKLAVESTLRSRPPSGILRDRKSALADSGLAQLFRPEVLEVLGVVGRSAGDDLRHDDEFGVLRLVVPHRAPGCRVDADRGAPARARPRRRPP